MKLLPWKQSENPDLLPDSISEKESALSERALPQILVETAAKISMQHAEQITN